MIVYVSIFLSKMFGQQYHNFDVKHIYFILGNDQLTWKMRHNNLLGPSCGSAVPSLALTSRLSSLFHNILHQNQKKRKKKW